MRTCAIVNCPNNNNSSPSLRFYQFPSDLPTRRAWEKFCQPSVAVKRYVCREHFADESWILQDVLLNLPLDKRKLAPGAVPSVNVPNVPANTRVIRQNHREQKRIVSEAVKEYDHKLAQERAQEEFERLPKTVSTQTQNCVDETAEAVLKRKIKLLEKELQMERESKVRINRRLQTLQQIESSVCQWFSPAVIRAALTGKRTRWIGEDIAAAIPLYKSGPQMYELLRDRGCPLPGKSTLERWAHKKAISLGTSDATTQQLTDNEFESVERPDGEIMDVPFGMDDIWEPMDENWEERDVKWEDEDCA